MMNDSLLLMPVQSFLRIQYQGILRIRHSSRILMLLGFFAQLGLSKEHFGTPDHCSSPAEFMFSLNKTKLKIKIKKSNVTRSPYMSVKWTKNVEICQKCFRKCRPRKNIP